MSTPTINGGYELNIGDWIELDVESAPDCCEAEMRKAPKTTAQQTYRCDDCKTVLIVNSNGVIFDIR
ncbi:hypothetical protein PUR59_00530 [Streptomyces sp. SP18ES09]|uniref:hypothetical protein n=1 Tax=Streptomyces sp. SP18ES09 TaxID=3002532 RepID=UPI002E76D926|nr:hypothetical protein [Streptomyces sp. SP18ES09]MEE1813537.1 hypothetical protein [Streptomyces sp. SP18ES09]